jgi:hypothetical protein
LISETLETDMSTPKHTPLPWRADGPEVIGLDGNGNYAGHVATAWYSPGGPGPDEAVANAALIVRAVNAHADLLEALETLVDEQNGPPLYRHAAGWEAAMNKARAAIAKARGA